MTLYEALLFLHIGFAIVWIGSGSPFHVLGHRADRVRDEAAVKRVFDEGVVLVKTS